MKKILIILTTILLSISIVGCSNFNKKYDNDINRIIEYINKNENVKDKTITRNDINLIIYNIDYNSDNLKGKHYTYQISYVGSTKKEENPSNKENFETKFFIINGSEISSLPYIYGNSEKVHLYSENNIHSDLDSSDIKTIMILSAIILLVFISQFCFLIIKNKTITPNNKEDSKEEVENKTNNEEVSSINNNDFKEEAQNKANNEGVSSINNNDFKEEVQNKANNEGVSSINNNEDFKEEVQNKVNSERVSSTTNSNITNKKNSTDKVNNKPIIPKYIYSLLLTYTNIVISYLISLSIAKWYSKLNYSSRTIPRNIEDISDIIFFGLVIIVIMALIGLFLLLAFVYKNKLEIFCVIVSSILLLFYFFSAEARTRLYLLFLFFLAINYVVLKSLPKLYNWLYNTNTKQLDPAKITLVWTIVTFLLGILFNLKV